MAPARFGSNSDEATYPRQPGISTEHLFLEPATELGRQYPNYVPTNVSASTPRSSFYERNHLSAVFTPYTSLQAFAAQRQAYCAQSTRQRLQEKKATTTEAQQADLCTADDAPLLLHRSSTFPTGTTYQTQAAHAATPRARYRIDVQETPQKILHNWRAAHTTPGHLTHHPPAHAKQSNHKSHHSVYITNMLPYCWQNYTPAIHSLPIRAKQHPAQRWAYSSKAHTIFTSLAQILPPTSVGHRTQAIGFNATAKAQAAQ